MGDFVGRRPVLSLIVLLLVLVFLWLLLGLWPPGLVQVLGPKKLVLNGFLNGVTLGGLYFLVASGFTLIFGLMKNVNLAHGTLYLFGGYVGYTVAVTTGQWALAFVVAFVLAAVLGVILQWVVFRRMEGEDLRQTLVTLGISIVGADAMLWIFGGNFFQVPTPDSLFGAVRLPIVVAVNSHGPVFAAYSRVRLVIFLASVVLGIAMWLALNRTRIGMMIRAGVDDRDMLAASGVRIQVLFASVFAVGAGLAGLAGVIGGTFESLAPGEDVRFLLASLVVVIVGGLGSIPGAALGALLIGLSEQMGQIYIPSYSIALTFLIMVAVLAFRPQGILGRS